MAKANTKTSLRGIAYYPWLNTPDTKHKADGVYHVKLQMDSTDPNVAKFLAWIDEEHDKAVAEFRESQLGGDSPKFASEKALMAAVKKARKIDSLDGDKPYTYVTDEDGNDTDDVLVNFKMNAQFTNKKTNKVIKLKPKIFDAKGKLMENPPSIYGGSILKVSFTPMYWGTTKLGASVRLRLEAVQVIELKTGGGSNNAADYGFGEEEGYEATESDTTFSDETTAESHTLGDSDDEDF